MEAVDVHPQGWIVRSCSMKTSAITGDPCNLAISRATRLSRFEVCTHHLHIDRSRHAILYDGVHQAARQKEGVSSGISMTMRILITELSLADDVPAAILRRDKTGVHGGVGCAPAEKPLSTPMLSTVAPRSSGLTISLIRRSRLRASLSVTVSLNAA